MSSAPKNVAREEMCRSGSCSGAGAVSWLADVRATRETLEAFGLATKYRLGQNFLINEQVIRKIINLAELSPDDVVLEVGPGLGTLTVALLDRARAVCSVEADRELERVLDATCKKEHQDSFALIMGDALAITPERVGSTCASLKVFADEKDALASARAKDAYIGPTKFVSNLPYQVAATLILQYFQEFSSLKRAVVMVQAEVADRIAAQPGTKAYGAYTAKLALYARITGRFEVSPGNFMPPPRVNSAVVRLERTQATDPQTGEALDAGRLAQTAQVIDAAFAQRRKTIRNSMSASAFKKDTLEEGLLAAGIDPSVRAETFYPEDFVRLAAALAEGGSHE